MSSSSNGAVPAEDVLPNQLSNVTQELASHRHDLWRSNYHEASIYIEEGLNNDKFENHPRKRASKLVRRSTTTNALVPVQQQQQPQHISNPHQTSPLVSARTLAAPEFTSTAELKNNNINNNNNNSAHKPSTNPLDNDQQDESDDCRAGKTKGGGGDKPAGGGTFLLGGQYTTIETYILVHNRYFYQLDLAASIILLLLALVEPPAVDGYELSPAIHAAIEMFALGIIAIELLLKFRWMGPGRFFSHGRTVSKLVVLLAMNLEAIVILLRHSIHARYSRALRPIFLMDNHYCHGLRRAVRQIFQSLPPIIDMFTLAMFFMFVFSIFGFYLFASNNHYFSDMPKTVGNLLVLATTANLPDIMMPSYAVSRWSAIYFVLFIIIHLFLFTNLTMAAVYEIFTRKEKEKFHKLLLHRRKACQKAFKLLVSRRQPNKIQYRQFMGLMRYLNQKCSMLDAYLIYKALDTDKSGSISLEEFYQIYDFINLEWDLIYPQFRWHDAHPWLPEPLRGLLLMSERVIRHRFFEWSIDLLIVAQALLQFVEASAFELPIPGLKMPLLSVNSNVTVIQETAAAEQQQVLAGASVPGLVDLYIRPDRVSTVVFIGIFLLEAVLRCLALGARKYWAQRWNRFDLLVLLISLAGLLSGSLGGYPFGWVLVLRVLRLMRVFEFKRRYKDMWQTLTYILLKRFVSMTCVVMILYYFFAIIGMELMGDYDLRNCCQNTSIESQFRYDNSTDGAKYYLNDFGDVIASYLTLFSMTSNTYWLATMEAYAIVAQTNWVRLFFGLYYLGSIIVMNIVIAFILESFLFHIHYRNKMGDSGDDTNLFTVSVTLSSLEVDFLRENLTSKRDTDKLDRTVEMLRAKREREANAKASSKKFGRWRRNDHDEEAEGETVSLLRGAKKRAKQSQQPSHKPRDAAAAAGHAMNGNVPLAHQETALADTARTPARSAAAKRHSASVSSESSGASAAEAGASAKREAAQLAERQAKTRGVGFAAKHHDRVSDSDDQLACHRPEWYLIYQAEQIRNKFSFTMKMYADEVGAWLAEAEQADQDEMSLMISRNQIRAEHVAMARLARRNLAEIQTATLDDGHLLDWTRPRSWSTSGGGGPGGGNSGAHLRDRSSGSEVSPTKKKPTESK